MVPWCARAGLGFLRWRAGGGPRAVSNRGSRKNNNRKATVGTRPKIVVMFRLPRMLEAASTKPKK